MMMMTMPSTNVEQPWMDGCHKIITTPKGITNILEMVGNTINVLIYGGYMYFLYARTCICVRL